MWSLNCHLVLMDLEPKEISVNRLPMKSKTKTVCKTKYHQNTKVEFVSVIL